MGKIEDLTDHELAAIAGWLTYGGARTTWTGKPPTARSLGETLAILVNKERSARGAPPGGFARALEWVTAGPERSVTVTFSEPDKPLLVTLATNDGAMLAPILRVFGQGRTHDEAAASALDGLAELLEKRSGT